MTTLQNLISFFSEKSDKYETKEIVSILNKAIEEEKKQIIDAYIEGKFEKEDSEKYYSMISAPKYAKEAFDGYTHRFVVQFETGEPYYDSLHIYSDSGDRELLTKFIEEKKTDKVIDYSIVHRATKEQDERVLEFLDDFLKD